MAVALLFGVALVPHCATRPAATTEAVAPAAGTHPPDANEMAAPADGAHPADANEMAAPAAAPHPADANEMATPADAPGMVAPGAETAAIPVVHDPDPFRGTVRPILSTRCAPCHEAGGKMYARLPFDDAKTVSSNSAAILRRLKGDDRAALEKWLAGLAPPAAPR